MELPYLKPYIPVDFGEKMLQWSMFFKMDKPVRSVYLEYISPLCDILVRSTTEGVWIW